MKGKFYPIAFLFIVIIFASCKSASKLYKQGNYDEAVEVAVKKLQKKPNDPEMRSLIQSAYQYAVNDHESRIRNYTQSSNDLKYEWVYNEYVDLQNLYNSIYRAPEIFELVRPVDYSSQVTSFREKAGDVHISRGRSWMKSNDKESFKSAYREFQAAMRFKPGDIKIQQLMDDAYDAALTRVVITQTDNPGLQFSSYNYNSDQNSADNMIRNLANNSGNEFVRFYSVLEARSKNIQPDQVIELRLNNILIQPVQESRSTRELIKEVVVKETVYKPDSVVKEYRKVKARLTTTRKTLYADGNLGITIRDNTGNFLWNDNVNGQNTWCSEFTTYTGDERALSEEDKQLINRRTDNIPAPQSIISYIRQEIFQNSLYKIKDFYSRY